MADRRGYWSVAECRWMGADLPYVVPPVAVANDGRTPILDVVPAQRPDGEGSAATAELFGVLPGEAVSTDR